MVSYDLGSYHQKYQEKKIPNNLVILHETSKKIFKP